MRSVTVLVLTLVAVSPVFAQQSSTKAQENMRFGALRKFAPQRQLFDVQQSLKQAVETEKQHEASKPKVVCGMLVVPADPTLDPKMRVTPPQDPSVEYKIRTLEPSICHSPKN